MEARRRCPGGDNIRSHLPTGPSDTPRPSFAGKHPRPPRSPPESESQTVHTMNLMISSRITYQDKNGDFEGERK